MVAGSEDGTETCTEEGEVTYDLASEAELTGGDYTSVEKTERCVREEDLADAVNIVLEVHRVD